MLPELSFIQFIFEQFFEYYSSGRIQRPRPGEELIINPEPNLPEPDEEEVGGRDDTFGTPEAPSGYNPRIPKFGEVLV